MYFIHWRTPPFTHLTPTLYPTFTYYSLHPTPQCSVLKLGEDCSKYLLKHGAEHRVSRDTVDIESRTDPTVNMITCSHTNNALFTHLSLSWQVVSSSQQSLLHLACLGVLIQLAAIREKVHKVGTIQGSNVGNTPSLKKSNFPSPCN